MVCSQQSGVGRICERQTGTGGSVGWGGLATLGVWSGADAERPVVVLKDGIFYLFRNKFYGRCNLNTQYASPDPLDFGVDDDCCRIGALAVVAPEIILSDGRRFVAALNPELDGIRIARLCWR